MGFMGLLTVGGAHAPSWVSSIGYLHTPLETIAAGSGGSQFNRSA